MIGLRKRRGKRSSRYNILCWFYILKIIEIIWECNTIELRKEHWNRYLKVNWNVEGDEVQDRVRTHEWFSEEKGIGCMSCERMTLNLVNHRESG